MVTRQNYSRSLVGVSRVGSLDSNRAHVSQSHQQVLPIGLRSVVALPVLLQQRNREGLRVVRLARLPREV